MLIYYPTYYLVPVTVMSLDQDEYSDWYNLGYNRCNIGANGFFSNYRNIDEDIFEDIDEEYVNESTK